MESLTKEKSYCPTCGHIIAKERTNLSSLEFRRLIHKFDTLEEIINNKEHLFRFIKSSYNRDFADQFLEDLEARIRVESLHKNDLDSLKLWLLGFVNNEVRAFPPKEINLYKFLCINFPEIDMPFSEFYDSYVDGIEDPMSKNRVSRALLAFGIRTTMKRIIFNGRTKNSIMICISKEELLNLYQKNGLISELSG